MTVLWFVCDFSNALAHLKHASQQRSESGFLFLCLRLVFVRVERVAAHKKLYCTLKSPVGILFDIATYMKWLLHVIRTSK